ncbi:MAG: glycosyltransferase family 4 protein [Pseudomonadota bacterium]
MTATAAIFHHPDAVERPTTPLAGRRTAGQSFLRGYARHASAEVLHCVAGQAGHIELFRELMTDGGWTGDVTGHLLAQPETLAAPGTMMLPGPNLGTYAWTRRRVGQAHHALCGITHTMSTRRIMEGLTDMLTSPIESWDAVICTSQAVRSVVENQFDEIETYLRGRFAARRVPRPQLPVIPLGIDTAQFAREPQARAAWRDKMGIGANDIAIMSMGRLSVSEKMHPGPLLIALQKVADATDQRIVLIMVGWFNDEPAESLHRTMAEAFAPDVEVVFPDGKDDRLRYEIWSAADIFAMPVDNIQETYGLAPVEAMAAGLPVVCSDWNGFRDTVDDGVTGIRVRTLMAAPGGGRAIAGRFEAGQDNYHQYLVQVHQRTAVDVPEMVAALTALVGDTDFRERMGQAGAERARNVYDWSNVVPQYEALWAEQTARRTRETPSSAPDPNGPWNPNSMDPFALYAKYPTMTLRPDARISAKREVSEDDLKEFMRLTGAVRFKRMVSPAEDLAVIHHAVRTLGPVSFGELMQRTQAGDGVLEAAVLWMAKFDLVQIET